MKPLLEIIKLNQTRYGLDFNGSKAFEKLHEEIIEELAPATITNDVEAIVDALSKVMCTTASHLVALGYNPELVMKQSVKSLMDPTHTKNFSTCKLQQH